MYTTDAKGAVYHLILSCTVISRKPSIHPLIAQRLPKVCLHHCLLQVSFKKALKLASLYQPNMNTFQLPLWRNPASRFPVQDQASPSLYVQTLQDRSPIGMSNQSQSTSVISALGTLIGYIGSEAATEDVFQRLLWPQRFFNAFSWQDLLQIGFLYPMGGPLHKAALTTLDKFHQSGLFRGKDLGNMLGTAFFHDTGLKYKAHDPQSNLVEKEFVRNGLWVQGIARIPVAAEGQRESSLESGMEPRRLIRSRSVVNVLELSYVERNVEPSKTVKNDTGHVSYRALLAIVWSEITGLVVGGGCHRILAIIFQFLLVSTSGTEIIERTIHDTTGNSPCTAFEEECKFTESQTFRGQHRRTRVSRYRRQRINDITIF